MFYKAMRNMRFLFLLLLLGSIMLSPSSGEAADKKFSLSASAGGMAADSPAGKAMDLFAEKVAGLSNGSIKVEVFYESTLGDPTALVQALQQGTVDVAATGDSYFAGLVPELQIFELPFLFDSYEEARSAVDGPVGQKISKKYDGTGIKPLGFWEIGFRHLTNNVRPIRKPSDLRGIKIRTLPAPIQVKTWEVLGALPTPIDFSELYTALQQGVVDAQENPLSLIRTSKFYEVQKYLTLTGHVYTPMFLGMSQMTWDRLSPSQQEAVIKAALEAQSYERNLVSGSEEEDLKFIENHGVEVIRDPEKEAFKNAITGVYKIFTDKYGSELLNELMTITTK